MRMYLSIWLIGSIWGGGALGQYPQTQSQEENEQEENVVQEALPQRFPVRPQSSQFEGPTPVTLDVPEAFREGQNIYDLGPVSAERIAEADQAAAREPGPARVGVVRTIDPGSVSLKGTSLEESARGASNVWTAAIRSPGAFGTACSRSSRS